MPKQVSSSLRIQGFSSGLYIVSGNIKKEDAGNGRIVYRPDDKEFGDKDAKQNRKDALAFAKKIQAEVLETLD